MFDDTLVARGPLSARVTFNQNPVGIWLIFVLLCFFKRATIQNDVKSSQCILY